MLAQMPFTYRAENTGADVKTPRMPPYAELPAIAHLPDPFTMADGTRMTTRDQWRMRRAEIKAMVEKYGAGEKPGKPSTFKKEFSGNTLTMTVGEGDSAFTMTATISRRTLDMLLV